MVLSWRQSAVPLAVAKCHRHLLPLFVFLVITTYIDRTSLSFAALQLCRLNWFNARVLGLGSAAFTVSYVLLQIPSNLALQRVGPKVWLPAITTAWGVVSMCCAAINGPASFYLLRLLLGASEAGCFPGMWWTCEQFYPPSHITFAYSSIEAAIAVAQILAAPIAAALIATDGFLALAGWQTLFLVQGSVTVLYAAVLRWYLPASLELAPFLGDDDRRWLREQKRAAAGAAVVVAPANGEIELGCADAQVDEVEGHDDSRLLLRPQQRGDASAPADGHNSNEPGLFEDPELVPMSALQQIIMTARNLKVWHLIAIKVLKDCSLDALVYWTPVLIKALLEGGTVPLATQHSVSEHVERCGGRQSQLVAIAMTMVPFGLAAAASLAIGHSSEASGERRLHIGLPLLIGGLAFGAMPFFLHLGSIVAAFICVVLAVIAADATTGPFWSLVLSAAPGASAVAFPAVNSIGKAGGAIGPAAFGLLTYYTGSLLGPIMIVTVALLGAGMLAVAYRHDRRAPHC